MRRTRLLCGLLLLLSSGAQAGVGLGVATELRSGSPLLGGGRAAPPLRLPSPQVVSPPAYSPAPSRAAAMPAHVVPPLPGATRAPVAVTVGPTVFPGGGHGWFRRQHAPVNSSPTVSHLGGQGLRHSP